MPIIVGGTGLYFMALTEEQLSQASRVLIAMREQIANAVVGQTAVIDQVLVALVARYKNMSLKM